MQAVAERQERAEPQKSILKKKEVEPEKRVSEKEEMLISGVVFFSDVEEAFLCPMCGLLMLELFSECFVQTLLSLDVELQIVKLLSDH